MQKTEELRQLLQSMWNELDQATSAKYEKMEAEDKTRCVCLRACVFVSVSAVLVSDLNRRVLCCHDFGCACGVPVCRTILVLSSLPLPITIPSFRPLIECLPLPLPFLSPPTRYNREMAAFTASASESSKKKKKDE
jgi:hypothetical protein